MPHDDLIAEGAPGLPWDPSARDEAGPPDPDAPRPAPGPVVLVVDDDPVVRTCVKAILEHAGFQVLAAPGGEEALALCRDYPAPVAALVTDLLLPGMRALDLVARLRERYPALKAVGVSGFTLEGWEARQLWDDSLPFLQKPFALNALAGTLRRLLDEPGPGYP